MKVYPTLIFLLFSQITAIYGQLQVQLSEPENVNNPVNYPHFAYYPDGHISVIPDDLEYIMFWAEFESHRSIGKSQFVEDQITLDPTNAVFGSRCNYNTYDNGGSWLMSVFREQGDELIGFFHAEDHWYPHTSNDIAWKSLGVTYSTDEGKTWSTGSQIITSPTAKPATPTWGGSGDCCVVWDHINNRWMCYYQENWILMAISTDPKGAPGTWKKYYNGAFTEDGLGGQHTKLPGLSSASGGNPSVHWNTYLDKWVMVWHGWSPPVIYISASADGVNWETPQAIILRTIDPTNGKVWYPTIIGETDTEAGQIAKIYFAEFANSTRYFRTQTITFIDPDNTSPASAQINLPIDGSTISTEWVEITASVNNVKAAIAKAEFYADGVLIGSDNSFPYQFNWQPSEKGSFTINAIFTDTDGAIVESGNVTIVFDYNVGFNNYEKRDFLIYPCPSSDHIVLDELPAGKKEIQIYNVNQQLVYQKLSGSNQVNVDISEFAIGTYFLKIKADNSVLCKKFVRH
ncbi:MAG: T9SS type A sorting domain-containing protein [Bacteroidales bacterium]|nr:T9SS type A sorting domain-containing protein [Bacteroidales bacterium]